MERDEIEAIATGEVVAQQGDLTVPEDVEAMVQRTVDEFGGLEHLVTSAGGSTERSVSKDHR